jgi:two-component system, OmpR family, phosphate regulon sensor histidine kinase PhoR
MNEGTALPVVETSMVCTCAVVSAQPGLLLALAGFAAGFILCWIVWTRRGRGGSAARIQGNLCRLANNVQADLGQLQLKDAQDQLSRGWNALVEQVASARRDLEEYEIRRLARETVDRYQTRWLTEILNAMPSGVLTVSDDWTITFANESAARMLRTEPTDLVGHKLTEFLDENLAGVSLSGGAAIDRTFELRSGGASLRLTSIRSFDGAGSHDTALHLSDMSLQREIERSRSEFLYHVTHELRTPLTNIRAYAETLSQGVLTDPNAVRECYNVIIGETQRLSRLVEDILSLSQFEAGAARLVMDDVNIARLVRQVVEDMQAAADEKGLDLHLSLPPKVPTLRGDKDRLAVVLTNLVGNAIKYTPSGGTVEVACESSDKRLRILVKDTGIGIDRSEHEKVFEKFYRSSDDKVGQIAGTGLGLALAHEIVRAHGGTIELDSEPGKGSTFTVVLPVESLAAVQT